MSTSDIRRRFFRDLVSTFKRVGVFSEDIEDVARVAANAFKMAPIFTFSKQCFEYVSY